MPNSDNTKPLEQPIYQPLQNLKRILKTTSERFNGLKIEAREALYGRDTEKYKEKLKERTKLIIDLPNQIESELANIETTLKEDISSRTRQFSLLAEETLKDDNMLWMSALLDLKGSNIEDKNLLEHLIDELEELEKKK